MEKPKLVTEKKIVPIDWIIPNPWNPNKMSDFIYQRMKDTIKKKDYSEVLSVDLKLDNIKYLTENIVGKHAKN